MPKNVPQAGAVLIREAMQNIPGVDGKRYRLAKLLGIDPANIANWLKGAKVDPRYCVAIEHFSDGTVPAHLLRPDVFPAPGHSLPEHPNATEGRDYAGR